MVSISRLVVLKLKGLSQIDRGLDLHARRQMEKLAWLKKKFLRNRMILDVGSVSDFWAPGFVIDDFLSELQNFHGSVKKHRLKFLFET